MGKDTLFEICSRIGFRPRRFLLPAILATFAAIFEALAALLLIPALSLLFDPTTNPPRIILSTCQLVGFPDLSKETLTLLLCASTTGAALLKLIFSFASVSFSVSLSHQFTRQLQSSLFRLLSQLDNRFFLERRHSDLSYLLQAFPERLVAELRPLHRNLANSLMLISYSVVLLAISWKLSIFCVFLAIGYQMIMAVVLRKLRERALRTDSLRSHIGSQISRLTSCYNLMKLLGESEREALRFDSTVGKYNQESEAHTRYVELIHPLFDALSIVMIILVTFASHHVWGRLDLNSLPMFLVFVFILRRGSGISSGIRELQAHYVAVENSLEKIAELFHQADSFRMPSGNLEFTGSFYQIQMKNISFSYASEIPLLRGIDLRIRKGSRIALVGASGSGKTTLVQFLVRLWSPDSGAIFIDEIPIESFTANSLRHQIGLVCQDTSEVFSGSIRENLLYGLVNQSEDEMKFLLGELGLLERFESLPKGLDTPISDKGLTLSGGERQLLSFIRTLLRKTSIIILDEVTSSLDPETAEKVERALRQFAPDATIIEVTHRFSRATRAEQIYLLSEGRLIGYGSSDELSEDQRRFMQILGDSDSLPRN